jgi:hypothetical protein
MVFVLEFLAKDWVDQYRLIGYVIVWLLLYGCLVDALPRVLVFIGKVVGGEGFIVITLALSELLENGHFIGDNIPLRIELCYGTTTGAPVKAIGFFCILDIYILL